jgi:hypothetical protein
MPQINTKVVICIFKGKMKKKSFPEVYEPHTSLNASKVISGQDFKGMILRVTVGKLNLTS